MNNFGEKVSFIRSVADLLRGPYRPNHYKDVILPMIVLRWMDCVLEPTKDAVLARYGWVKDGPVKNLDSILNRVSEQGFYNNRPFTFDKLKGDPGNLAANLTAYIKGFSENGRHIIEHFGFEEHIGKHDTNNCLFLVVSRFCEIDLHPDTVSNIENMSLSEDIDAYMAREVLPHVPDAWVDESKTKVGYGLNFNRYFYTYGPPRPLEEIEADLREIEGEIAELLGEVA